MAEEDMIMARQRELKRLHVIEKVLEGIIKQVEAAEILSLRADARFAACMAVISAGFMLASRAGSSGAGEDGGMPSIDR